MPTRKYKYKVTKIDDSSCGNLPYRFRLNYYKDTNVYARASTLGVMTFKRRKDAKYFIQREGINLYEHLKIKRVIPIGRGYVPKLIALADVGFFYQ